MHVDLIIPALNESIRLQRTLEKLARLYAKKKMNVIVVCEGKCSFVTPKNLHVIRVNTKERGKWAAINQGIVLAKGDAIVIDADLPFDEKHLKEFEHALKKNDVVIAVKKKTEDAPFYRGVLTASMEWIAHNVFGLRVSDTQCGLKAFSKRAIARLFPVQSTRLIGDIEILWRATALGMRIKEIQVEWRFVPGGPIEQKKWSTLARMILDLKILAYQTFFFRTRMLYPKAIAAQTA